jgi:hypothetical protein
MLEKDRKCFRSDFKGGNTVETTTTTHISDTCTGGTATTPYSAGFEDFTAVSMKNAVFWNVVPTFRWKMSPPSAG